MLSLARNWWAFVIRGIAAIIFGILTFLMPGMALITLVFLFGFYALLDGVFNLVGAFRRSDPQQTPWWALLIEGLIGIIAGLVALLLPGLTAIALLYLIAAWAFVTGIFEIAAAIRLRKHIQGEWVLTLSGVLSIILGALLAMFPGIGALAVVLWIGAYAVVFGILLIALGIRLRSLVRHEDRPGHGFPTPATGH